MALDEIGSPFDSPSMLALRPNSVSPLRIGLDALVISLGVAALYRMLVLDGRPQWTAFSVVLLLACVGTRMRLHLPGLQGSLSLWFPFGFAAILGQPPWAAFLVLGVAGLFERLQPNASRGERSLEHLLEGVYFLASTAMATLVASSAVSLVSGDDGLLWAARASLAAVAYFAVWSVLAATRLALVVGGKPWSVWNRQYFWASPIYLLAPCGALVTGLLVDGHNLFDTLLGLSAIACTYWYLQTYFPRLHEQQDHIEKLARVRQKALETLAVAIEAKDGSTAGHLERVKLLAGRLAVELGCTPDELRTLELAAVLHDVGKIGVPDSVLCKPGRLTETEFQAIVAHAGIGADIVASMEFPEPVDAVVRCHHEHWDGSGYPAGLAAEQIPRLARILTVVDCFDALVSERPYRKPLSIEQAADLMRRQKRKIFDPEVLDVFLDQLSHSADEIRRKLRADSQAARTRAEVSSGVRQTWIDGNAAGELPESVVALQDLAGRRDLLMVYQEVMEGLGSDLEFETAFERVLGTLSVATQARAAALFDYDPEREAFVLRHGLGLALPEDGDVGIPANQGLAAEAARRKIPLATASTDDDADGLGGVGSKLATPLLVDGRLIGLLLLGSDQVGVFGAKETSLLGLLSRKLALTLQAADDLKRMRVDAQTDPVTTLPNARASLRRLEQEVHRAEREGLTLGVLFMDVNGLKMINDTYGHGAGDRLLLATGRKLRGALRSYDFVGRLGGDEFLALLPGIAQEDLPGTIVHLKKALEMDPVNLRDGELGYTRISAGGAHFPSEATNPRALLELSDERMYKDKAATERTPPKIARRARGVAAGADKAG
ncbi:MAG: diguanylate cyclase [Acidobacteria bacterium]|nr:diguanylate cyclase [Acidobacteriota bacterium]